jgi:hypothetical protein
VRFLEVRSPQRGGDAGILGLETRGAGEHDNRFVGPLQPNEACADATQRVDVVGGFEEHAAIDRLGQVRAPLPLVQTGNSDSSGQVARVGRGAPSEFVQGGVLVTLPHRLLSLGRCRALRGLCAVWGAGERGSQEQSDEHRSPQPAAPTPRANAVG